jgi:Integrase/Phage integrase, N-terminal
MTNLFYELSQLAKASPARSKKTQANRLAMLKQMSTQLLRRFKQMHAHELKGRHEKELLRIWAADGVSDATKRNREAVLRWWARAIGNPGAVSRSNKGLGFTPRRSIPTRSKAQELPPDQLATVRNPYVRMSLRLQRAFGLRREESILLQPVKADRGTHLALDPSWTKGGRGGGSGTVRLVPIVTPAQRALLEEAKALAGPGRLIPPSKDLKRQLNTYQDQTRRAGLRKMHGLRHAYAQARFHALAGFPSPLAGGPARQDYTPAERAIAEEVWLIVSEELGHSRTRITHTYLGTEAPED